MLRLPLALALLSIAAAAHAQFEIQDSTTTADLRGIASVGNGTAWASGTHGTVLRTEDGGFVWQGCTTPPGAEKLDFRGIQAFDDRTAIVMSSGKGDLSRVYKTTDGCVTWKLVFTNPDAEGFFDGLIMNPPGPDAMHDYGVVVGDPVAGAFALFVTFDRGSNWERMKGPPRAKKGEALFAASNQALVFTGSPNGFAFITGGVSGARVLRFADCDGESGQSRACEERWSSPAFRNADPRTVMSSPFARGWASEPLNFPAAASAGAFAFASKWTKLGGYPEIIVGGDYAKPQKKEKTAAYYALISPELQWRLAIRLPHGYRSSVAYDSSSKTWITVGPNGTDISTDDGKNWKPLRPGKDDQPDADRNWNALSLPFVVGPHGRIGRLQDDVLSRPSPAARH